MLIWNIFESMPILLLMIMCALPSIMMFGIFIQLDNKMEKKENGFN